VRALVRDPAGARAVLPEGVEPVAGDVTDPSTVAAATAGCEVVFNAMGLPEQWLRDETLFDRVNAEGTHHVAQAARAAGVRRLVHTSTEDVFHADSGARFDETDVAGYPKGTAYERSKQRAEELALAARDGLDVVVVNPAGVYGPGPSASVSFDKGMFEPLVRRRLPALPPGGLGLVYVDGLAQGHLLAADRGRDGERYILCDTHASLRELAQTVVHVAGRGRVPPTLPVPLARGMAAGSEALSRVIGRPPLLSRGQLYFFRWNAHPDSSKAQSELGWATTPLEEGLRATLAAMGLIERSST
jgi:dihydroflavonol-4-reductase